MVIKTSERDGGAAAGAIYIRTEVGADENRKKIQAEELLNRLRQENDSIRFSFMTPSLNSDARYEFDDQSKRELQDIINLVTNAVGNPNELLKKGLVHICICDWTGGVTAPNTFNYNASAGKAENLRALCELLRILIPREIADDVTEVAFDPGHSDADDDIQPQAAAKIPKTKRNILNTLTTTALAVGIAIASSGIVTRNKPTDEIKLKETDSHVYLISEKCQFRHSLDGFRASCETTIERDLTRAEASFDWIGKPYTDENGNTMQNAKIKFTTPATEDDMKQEHCESGEPILVKKNVPVGDIQKSEVTFVCKAQ